MRQFFDFKSEREISLEYSPIGCICNYMYADKNAKPGLYLQLDIIIRRLTHRVALEEPTVQAFKLSEYVRECLDLFFAENRRLWQDMARFCYMLTSIDLIAQKILSSENYTVFRKETETLIAEKFSTVLSETDWQSFQIQNMLEDETPSFSWGAFTLGAVIALIVRKIL